MSDSLNHYMGKRCARGSAAVPGCEFQHRPGAWFFIPGRSGGETPPEPAGEDARATQKITKRSHRLRRAGSKFQIQGSKFPENAERTQIPAKGDKLRNEPTLTRSPLPSDRRGEDPDAAWGHAAYSAQRAAMKNYETKPCARHAGSRFKVPNEPIFSPDPERGAGRERGGGMKFTKRSQPLWMSDFRI